jgi:MFS family permease
VFRILAQNWSQSIGRHWMLVRGLIGHAVGHLLLSFATQSWQFVLPSIICGFGHALLFPAVVSLGAGAFPPEARGSGTAIILAFTDFGSLVFAPLLGRVIVTAGFEAMFCTSSAVAFTVAMVYGVIALRHPDAESTLQKPQGPIPADE